MPVPTLQATAVAKPLLDDVASRARRRIARRIVPYLFLLYIIAFLDRVNVSYAALEMTGALNFTPEVYGFGAGVFFAGYFLLEIPGCILVERWSARLWIARIMISWGIVAVLTGLIHNTTQFYWARFLLGVAEAGFFPGMIVYLSHWFRYEDRAKAVAFFMAAQPIANIIGSPLSGVLLGIHWLGIAGWRWLFILEGLPAIVFGVVTVFYLTDRPHQANWLPEEERRWLLAELEQEKHSRQAAHGAREVLTTLAKPAVLLLTLTYFCTNTCIYGFTLWLPTILKSASGTSNLFVGLIGAIPYTVGLAAILFAGWSSDRTGERRWHTAVPLLLVSLGLFLGISFRSTPAVWFSLFCIGMAGMFAYLPGFWSFPSRVLTGTVAAASVGLINSIGNLGGFFGPYMLGLLSKASGSFYSGVVFLSASAIVAAAIVLVLPIRDDQAGHGTPLKELMN